MTIEELLDCSPDKLRAMSDKELNEFFAPYLIFTRPEQQTREVKSKPSAFMPNRKQQADRLIEMFEKKFGTIV